MSVNGCFHLKTDIFASDISIWDRVGGLSTYIKSVWSDAAKSLYYQSTDCIIQKHLYEFNDFTFFSGCCVSVSRSEILKYCYKLIILLDSRVHVYREFHKL